MFRNDEVSFWARIPVYSRKESVYGRGRLPAMPETVSKKSHKVRPPRLPVVSTKVQTPDPKDPEMYVRSERSRKSEVNRKLPPVSKKAARLPPPVPCLEPPPASALGMTKEKLEWARSQRAYFERRWRY